ncbi:MAG: phosphonate C-P lyase system protein PhnK [Desulfobacteraceae bacterium]|nr:MAG: phosphonate C-P lyase system protein PhnK [Desulfobacteraceae bacterium]
MASLMEKPILQAQQVSKFFGTRAGCRDVSFTLWPGEVLGIVGESGSGKTTLLNTLAGQWPASGGRVQYDSGANGVIPFNEISEPQRRYFLRTQWGMVHQNPRDGLRMRVSAGANVGERLMALGERHYGRIRAEVLKWLEKVEIDADRVDDFPQAFSGGMLQRLQIARNLVTRPRLVLMDEPTGGLDVSVQARLLDLLRNLVSELELSLIIVTHDLAIVRLLAHKVMVMRQGEVVEAGLTDQVLDDPQQPYTQLLVSSVIQP